MELLVIDHEGVGVTANLKFPVVMINNGDAAGFSNADNLQTCSEAAIDDEHMVGARIVDSEGNQFVVERVTKVKNVNLLPSMLVAYDRRIARAEYQLAEEGKIAFEDFKTLLVDTLKNNKVYEETGLLRSIKGSETYGEVIQSTGIN